MQRRTLGRLGVLLAVAVATIVGLQVAGSQPPFPDGAFVVGSDGTHWVVGNGQRVRLNFAEDASGQLATLAESPTVARTIAEAQAALAPAPSNPAETLVGQRVTACNYGVDFELTVTRVEWTKTVLGTSAPGNGMWIVAIIDVTNLGTEAEALVTRPLQLRDGRGREYNVREYPPDPIDLHRTYAVHAAFTDFEPGITEPSVVTFQVPDDVGPLTLVGKRDFC